VTTEPTSTIDDLSTLLVEAADLMQQVALVCGHTADALLETLAKVNDLGVS